MSYRDSSNRNGDLSQLSIKRDLVKKGWIVLVPESRDTIYDYVVDRGNGVFDRVQVKTLVEGRQLSKFVDRSREVVSKNGKARNSHDYAKEGIEWLAGYNKETEEIHYFHHDTYSKIEQKSFSVNKYKQDGFPTNEVPNRHNKRSK
jgi:hypothetical protein